MGSQTGNMVHNECQYADDRSAARWSRRSCFSACRRGSGSDQDRRDGDPVAYRTRHLAFRSLSDPRASPRLCRAGRVNKFYHHRRPLCLSAGRLTGIDEARILAEISEEYARLQSQFDRPEKSIGPVLHAMEKIHRRSLPTRFRRTLIPHAFTERSKSCNVAIS